MLCTEKDRHLVRLGQHSAAKKEEKKAVNAIRRLPTANHLAIHLAIHLHDDGCGRGLDVVVAQCPWSWLRLRLAGVDPNACEYVGCFVVLMDAPPTLLCRRTIGGRIASRSPYVIKRRVPGR